MSEVNTTAVKALQVLRSVSELQPVDLSGLHGETGLNKATLLRMLGALVAEHFVIKDTEGIYCLGPAVTKLAMAAGRGGGIEAWARPHLEELIEQTGETVFLSVRHGPEILYLDVLMPDAMVRMHGAPGTTAPLHSTSQGKVLVAFLPKLEREAIVSEIPMSPATLHSIFDPVAFTEELDQVVSLGYAINDGELDDGVRSVAVPIRDELGIPFAAVCVGAPSFRCSLKRLHQELAPIVIAAARKIEHQLGLTNSGTDSVIASIRGAGALDATSGWKGNE